MGEWYYPNNMSTVRTQGEGGSFFRNRGQSVIHLHRRHNATMPTGLFYCEVPDENGDNQDNQRIYVMILEGIVMYC